MGKTKFNCFEKMAIFSYSLLPRRFKFRRSSLRLVFLIKIVYNIVQTPLSFFKVGEVNFVDYLPRRGESEKLEKGGGSMVQGQVLLKVCEYVCVFEGGGGEALTLFVCNFFKVYHLYI